MVDPKCFSDAVWNGDVAAVAAMIAGGANVDAADIPRNPPLLLAIEQQWIEIVKQLIAAGAAINSTSEGGMTPLELAIDVESDSAWQSHHKTGYETSELAMLLLQSGAVPTERALKIAQDYKNTKALHLLMQTRKPLHKPKPD